MKFNFLSILFKLIIFLLLVTVLSVPLSTPTVNYTNTDISSNSISTTISFTSNKLFILDHADFSDTLYELFIFNKIPGVILSESHYDNSYTTTIEFMVYPNKLFQFLRLEPYTYIFSPSFN